VVIVRSHFWKGLVCVALTRCQNRDSVLRLTQHVILPAATEALVKLAAPYHLRRKTSSMETFPQLKNKFLVVANAVVHPTGR
jgi:hypothetical protein